MLVKRFRGGAHRLRRGRGRALRRLPSGAQSPLRIYGRTNGQTGENESRPQEPTKRGLRHSSLGDPARAARPRSRPATSCAARGVQASAVRFVIFIPVPHRRAAAPRCGGRWAGGTPGRARGRARRAPRGQLAAESAESVRAGRLASAQSWIDVRVRRLRSRWRAPPDPTDPTFGPKTQPQRRKGGTHDLAGRERFSVFSRVSLFSLSPYLSVISNALYATAVASAPPDTRAAASPRSGSAHGSTG